MSPSLQSTVQGVHNHYDENGRVPRCSATPAALKITLSPEQNNILRIVKAGGNVFFTGPAGTGKSVLLRAIIKELIETRPFDVIAITATTGIAALAIGGQTIHSYGGIGTGSEVAEILVRRIKRSRKLKNRWRATRVWIIDEVSMLKAELFDKLEYIARVIRKDNGPFGGIQLVLAGDFFQLPPVPAKGSAAPPDYAFGAKTWQACIPYPNFLEQVFRQRDDVFIDILSSMRLGNLNHQQVCVLKTLERPLLGAAGVQPAILLSCRRDVDDRNKQELEHLPGPSKYYHSMDSAGWDVYREPVSRKHFDDIMKQVMISPEELTLKIGAQVMLVQNVIQGVLVNGSMGKVTEFMTIHEAQKQAIHLSAPGNDSEDQDSLQSHDGLDYDEDEDFKSPPTQPPPYQHRTYIEECILGRYNADPTIAKRPTALRDITNRVFPPDKEYPLVHFANGEQLLCVPMHFDQIGLMGNIEVRRVQVPLILSWAITMHKSQGQTLDFVKVDFRRIFADGQAYVAVSRARSMDGLQLVNFQPQRVHASSRVVEWHSEWRDWWEEQRVIAEVVSDTSWVDDVLAEELRDGDAALYDSFNTEISNACWDGGEFYAKVNSGTSRVKDLMDVSEDEDEILYDSWNVEIPEFLIPTDL